MKLHQCAISDAHNLILYTNNPNIASYRTNVFPHPCTMENAIAFIKMVSKQNPTSVFAIEVNGEAEDSIGLHAQTDIMCKIMNYPLDQFEEYKAVFNAAADFNKILIILNK